MYINKRYQQEDSKELHLNVEKGFKKLFLSYYNKEFK